MFGAKSKPKFYLWSILLLFSFIAFGLTGCLGGGGGSSSTTTPESSEVEGYFIDEPVANLKVVDLDANNETTYTDEKGYFKLVNAKEGDNLEFYIGNLKIGSYKVSATSFVLTPSLINPQKDDIIVSLLRQLDNDTNATNGIYLPKPEKVVFNDENGTEITSIDNINDGQKVKIIVKEETQEVIKDVVVNATAVANDTQIAKADLIAKAYYILVKNSEENILGEAISVNDLAKITQGYYYDFKFDPTTLTATAQGKIEGELNGTDDDGCSIQGTLVCDTIEPGKLFLDNNTPVVVGNFTCVIKGTYDCGNGDSGVISDKAHAIMTLTLSPSSINLENAQAYGTLTLSVNFEKYSEYNFNCTKEIFLQGITSTSEVERTTWWYAYGGYSSDIPHDIIKTSTGDIIVVGTSTDYSSSQQGPVVLKLDEYGNIKWAKKIISDDLNAEDGFLAVAEGDNGFLAVGDSGIVAKIDSNGNVDWVKQIVVTLPDNATFEIARYLNDVVYLGNNTYVAVGKIASAVGGWITKIKEEEGNVTFTTKFYPVFAFYKVISDGNGGFLVAGSGSVNAVLLDFNSDFTLRWAKQFSNISAEEYNSRDGVGIFRMENGDILITGSAGAGEKVAVLELSSNGTFKWGKAIDLFTDKKEQGRNIFYSNTKKIVAMGDIYTISDSGYPIYENTFLITMDENGNLTQALYYCTDDEEIFGGAAMDDSGFLIAAKCDRGPSVAETPNFCVMQTNFDGRFEGCEICNTWPPTVNATETSLSDSSSDLNITDNSTAYNWQEKSISFTVEDLNWTYSSQLSY